VGLSVAVVAESSNHRPIVSAQWPIWP
jgi:hypothetical protein